MSDFRYPYIFISPFESYRPRGMIYGIDMAIGGDYTKESIHSTYYRIEKRFRRLRLKR